MATVIPFEERALARLRDRLGEAESARDDLLAFARGHYGATAAIHGAVLDALNAGSLEELWTIVTRRWPDTLRVDAIALMLAVGEGGFCLTRHGTTVCDPTWVHQLRSARTAVTARNVERGHPMFGPDSMRLRSQALVRIDSPAPFPAGVLAIGQCDEQPLDCREGDELLLFLADALAAMIRRWLTTQPTL